MIIWFRTPAIDLSRTQKVNNMKRIFLIAALSATVLFSCDKTKVLQYDNINGQTLAFFNSGTSASLQVALGESGSVEIEIGVSTISTSERTVTVSFDEEASEISSDSFTFNSSVTIPANSYFGTFSINADDSDDITTSPKSMVFFISNVPDGGVAEREVLTVSVFVVCPIPETYLVGNYTIEDVDAVVGPDNGTANFETGTVIISAASETSRQFTANVLPAFVGPEVITLDMVCGNFILQTVDPSITCDGPPYIFTDDTGANQYNLDSDQEFTITYIEDPEDSCGGPFISSFRLTKQ